MALIETLDQGGNLIYAIYIGVRDHIAEGVWKTAESDYKRGVNFTNWYPGEPNNWEGAEHCAVISTARNGKWNDVPCSYGLHFLCQFY